ncbi:hypothetical protein AVHY2522_05150 [Acidovorax sp. SUPP2522]|uniref:hypothetical protein n=1 Tax=unclassified Acidovorax TaxID=2684926 RepID=UPI002348F7FF|nr:MULTISPECIES: hypothetical protein [unclassified Acidovorax]WCM95843.1 hypothetical protein M5C96_15360 [Acidovorax sp. GBBC 1281]GKT14597.1 hypothetical protein AVHY2522_05150 [Acidovorax sp. SUPP2522]
MNDVYDRTALDGSISQLESVTANFAQRFIQDGKVRQSYIGQTASWHRSTAPGWHQEHSRPTMRRGRFNPFATGVFVGGALGALGPDLSFGWIF